MHGEKKIWREPPENSLRVSNAPPWPSWDMCAPCEEIKPYGTVGGLNEIIGINVTHSPGSWQLKLVLFSRSDLLDSVSALVRNEVCTQDPAPAAPVRGALRKRDLQALLLRVLVLRKRVTALVLLGLFPTHPVFLQGRL